MVDGTGLIATSRGILSPTHFPEEVRLNMPADRPPRLTRRDLLLSSTAALGLGRSALAESPSLAGSRADSHSDPTSLDAFELSQLIRARKVSCVEVMRAFLQKIATYNPHVNAIVSLREPDQLLSEAAQRDVELARGQYRGWLHGFPHAVKDLALTRGIRTTLGSPLTDTMPDHDEIFVERLRRSGAILIGKTNVPEFGYGSQTYNSIFGTTLNAYDQGKCAGGSSGGAAVALALRMLPVADGSDNMGSLRNPAAFNNVYGFRPSYGRVPYLGGDLFMQSLLVEGPMGRSVRDVAWLLSVMAGPDARVPFSIEQDSETFTRELRRDFRGTRIAWLGDFDGYLPTEPGILELCQRSHEVFKAAGCTVEVARVEFDPARLWEAYVTLRHAFAAANLSANYRDSAKRALIKPEIQWEIAGGLEMSAAELQRASSVRSDWYRATHKLFERYDFALIPSAQVFPFDAREHWPKEIAGRKMDTYHRWMEVTVGSTMGSLPALSVPVGFSATGLSMGMQIIGPRHKDFEVLQLGHMYDSVQPWTRQHLPPLLQTPVS